MAGDEKKGTYGVNPNFEWPPERYYNLAAYVLMFNGVVNSHDDYFIENSNGDQFINAYIEKHLEELVEKSDNIYGFIKLPKGMPRKPIKPDRQPWHTNEQYNALLKKAGFPEVENRYNADYAAWISGGGDAKLAAERQKARAAYEEEIAKFKRDLPNLIAKAKEFSKKANSTNEGYLGKMLTNEQMADVLKEKEDAVRKWHEDVRKASTSKSGQVDKDGKANHYHDWDNAQAELRNKNMIVRRNGWRTFRRLAATVLFGGVALASVSALLAYGGFALTAMFGTAFNATGVSGAVLGFIGTVAGGTFTKRFFGRFLDSLNEGRKLRRDRREFIKGFGKYSDKYEMGSSKQRQARGYRTAKQRFYENIAIQKFLEKGELTGENAYLKKYLKRGIKRGSIFNPNGDGGQPINYAQLKKESGYYKFVTDKYDPTKDNKGFKKMYSLLGASKSFNANDVHSVQAHTIYTEEFLQEAENGGHTLEEVKLKLEELKRGEGKFTDDNKDKYQELLYRFSDVVMTTMDRELFESSYDPDLLGTRKDMFEVPAIKERYEQTREGDCKEHAENAFKFIENLRTDTFAGGVISDRVDASIDNQVHIDSTHMKSACSKYGVSEQIEDPMIPGSMIPNPVYDMVQEACEKIGAITSKGSTTDTAYNDVEAAITYIETDTSVVPMDNSRKKAANYLKYMRDKKLAETTHDADSLDEAITAKGYTISSAIQNKIVALDSDYTPADVASVKEDIMTDTTLSEDERKFALDMVQTQVEAVERKKRNKAVIGALPSIRDNKFHEYKEYMDKLPKDEDEIDPEKIAIVLKDFKKVLPKEMAEFLIYKLKDKVASILKRKASSPKFDTTGGNYEATIEALQKYITNIGNCVTYGIIDEWQKNDCSKAIEAKIISAFGPYLEKLEKEFLKDVTKTRLVAETHLKEMKLGGFAEFLNSGTPVAAALKSRLTQIFDATNLSDLMSADSKGAAFGSLVCADNGETQTSLRIYFMQERKDGDVLYDVLKEMQVVTQSTGGFGATDNPELITATAATSESIKDGPGTDVATGDFTTKSYVYQMTNIVNSFSYVGTATDANGKLRHVYEYGGRQLFAEDMLAALLVMKKRTLAMLKAQMNQFYKKNMTSGESVANFAYRNIDALDRLKDKWTALADQIDSKVNALQSQVGTIYKGYKSCKQVVEAGTNYGKYATFVETAEMNA